MDMPENIFLARYLFINWNSKSVNFILLREINGYPSWNYNATHSTKRAINDDLLKNAEYVYHLI